MVWIFIKQICIPSNLMGCIGKGKNADLKAEKCRTEGAKDFDNNISTCILKYS